MSYGWNIGNANEIHIREESNSSPEPSTPEPIGFYWQVSRGSIPPNALRVGVDKDGGAIYAGRAFHEGDHIPAKVLESHEIAYVPYNGGEHAKHEFEVLCVQSGSVMWATNDGGNIQQGAVTCGSTSDGEPLYIGRVFHDGTLTPGKIHPSHGCCYIPYDGQELSFPNYEVLIIR